MPHLMDPAVGPEEKVTPPVASCSGGLGTMPAMEAAPHGPSASIDAPEENGSAVDDSVRAPATRAGTGSGDLTGTPTSTIESEGDDPEGPPFSPTTRILIGVGALLAVVMGLILRFWTRSDLWLDEALTVNIARLPVHEISAFLKRDGAPPLYYVLLHYWTGAFGNSDVAVRALAGLFGIATIPLAWLAGQRLGGRTAAWAAMSLVATSPFAVRYDTEARMYSLVALLTLLGFLALERALRAPRPGNLVAVAAVTGLLLYSHYWSVYLLGTTMLWLVFQAWRGRPDWRRGARSALVATVVGCLTFLPWLPIFFFQSQHTGTPWATPASFAAMVNAVASFAGGSTSQGRALALLFFALTGLGLFGLATDRLHIDIDIRTRRIGRPLAVVVLGTLAAAIVGGLASNSAFDARYASVVFIPLILMVSLGLTVFQDRHVRVAVLALAMTLGLAASAPNVTTNRTQAGEVAAAIVATAKPGDVIAYCPDQLGPAGDRLLPTSRYRQVTFPRGTGPAFVNWVDYADSVRDASPVAFAQHVETLAAGGHQIYMVWGAGYQAFGTKCEGVVQTLQGSLDAHGNLNYRSTGLVVSDDKTFYQPMSLVRLTPSGS
jgi:mannosyltransferase